MPTYRRPDLLEAVLPELVAQANSVEDETRIVIVDNDPDESARGVVESWHDVGVTYVPEARPGIAAARNAAIEAAAGADAIVFLDDDERPKHDWLQLMLATWSRYGCAAVAGPVLQELDDAADPWVAASTMFARTHRATGTIMEGAATGNLLLDLRELDRLRLRFDDRFGLTGGSDTLLTRTLIRRGGEIRWCDEAEAYEPVPPERARREWALRRRARTGNAWSRVHLMLAESPGERLRTQVALTALGIRQILRGALRSALGVVTRDLGRAANGALEVAAGKGVLGGAYGGVIAEYRREHPRPPAT
jgi:glycosyltransferase involved in cell wall biosynthesis